MCCISEIVSFIDSSRKLFERLKGFGREWKILHWFAGPKLAIWGFWLVSVSREVFCTSCISSPYYGKLNHRIIKVGKDL